MGKQGILLQILMDYFGEAETDIEDKMKDNLNREIINKIKEIKGKVSESKPKRGRENSLFENISGKKMKIEGDIKQIGVVLKVTSVNAFIDIALKRTEQIEKLNIMLKKYIDNINEEFKTAVGLLPFWTIGYVIYTLLYEEKKTKEILQNMILII